MSVTSIDTATKRIFNFSAGPATLPEPVLARAQQDLWSIDGSGIGILEHSHRGPVFDRVIADTEAACREVGGIGDDYAVLFLQGGATLQFAMVPMNFLPAGATADYLDTGVWTTKAIKEARRIGAVNVAFDGSTCHYDHTPAADEISAAAGAAYLHYCTNNTIYGTRYNEPPRSSAPLVADMSSDIFSRPAHIDRHALVYAGAQKNLGPAGTTLVIIRRDFMESGAEGLPLMLDYGKQAAKGSRLNTPPTFGIYLMGQVLRWILDQGGVAALERANREKAALIYDAVNGSGGFYRPVARDDCRSDMNICFRSPSDELDAEFLRLSAEHDMSGLKGHRDVGGLRASCYNAFPREGCEVLAQFMADFAAKNG